MLGVPAIPIPCHCARPSSIRASSSWPVAFGYSCATSHAHSPTKTSDSAAAKICGLPKRCDEKIADIGGTVCFTMMRHYRGNHPWMNCKEVPQKTYRIAVRPLHPRKPLHLHALSLSCTQSLLGPMVCERVGDLRFIWLPSLPFCI